MELGENTYRGLTVRIELDADPDSPREWSNLGTMTCYHRRYALGDTQDQTEIDGLLKTLNSIKRDGGVYLPLYLYDHSGLVMSTKPFSCPWDSGQVGYIHVSGKKIRAEYQVKRINKTLRDQIIEYLEGEVETYNQYLQNDVYGYTIENQDGEELESCWGFYGIEYASKEAEQVIDRQLNEEAA